MNVSIAFRLGKWLVGGVRAGARDQEVWICLNCLSAWEVVGREDDIIFLWIPLCQVSIAFRLGKWLVVYHILGLVGKGVAQGF